MESKKDNVLPVLAICIVILLLGTVLVNIVGTKNQVGDDSQKSVSLSDLSISSVYLKDSTQIINDSDSPVWVFMQIDIPSAEGAKYISKEFDENGETFAEIRTGSSEVPVYELVNLNADNNWVEVNTAQSELQPYYIVKTYAYKKVLAPHTTTSQLYTDVKQLEMIDVSNLKSAFKTVKKDVYTGAELDAMSNEELIDIVDQADNITRVDELENLKNNETITVYSTVEVNLDMPVTMHVVNAKNVDSYLNAWNVLLLQQKLETTPETLQIASGDSLIMESTPVN